MFSYKVGNVSWLNCQPFLLLFQHRSTLMRWPIPMKYPPGILVKGYLGLVSTECPRPDVEATLLSPVKGNNLTLHHRCKKVGHKLLVLFQGGPQIPGRQCLTVPDVVHMPILLSGKPSVFQQDLERESISPSTEVRMGYRTNERR